MKMRRLPRPLRAAVSSAGIVAIATSLTAAGCGKEPNTPRALMHFSHSFPEAPRALTLPNGALVSEARVGSPLLARDGDLVAVDRDNGAVVRVDAKTLKALETVAVGTRPEMIAAGPEGDLWVTVRGSGELLHLNADLTEVQRIRLGVDIYGLAVSHDGQAVYASLPMEGQVVTLQRVGGTFAIVDRLEVGELPRAIAWVPGTTHPSLVVTNQGGMAHRVDLGANGIPSVESLTQISLRDANPSEFKLASGDVIARRSRAIHPTRATTIAVNPEDGSTYIAHVLAAVGDPNEFIMGGLRETEEGAPNIDTSPSSGGGYGSAGGSGTVGREFAVPVRPIESTVTTVAAGTNHAAPIEPALPVRDEQTGEPMLQLIDQPSDTAHHPTHSLLFVVGEGTDNVLAFSTAEGDVARSPVAVMDVGRAPRAIAFSPDGRDAFVLNGFDFSVSRLDLSPLLEMRTVAARDVLATPVDPMGGASMSMPSPAMPADMPSSEFHATTEIRDDETPESMRVRPARLSVERTAAFASDPWPADLRQGAYIFTFARNESLSHAGQFACGTCHFEGTEDKMTWVTPDGVRQTIALAGRLQGTAPFNWNGSEMELSSNMNKTISRMGGEGLDATELAQLESFLLNGLAPIPNPHQKADGALTAQQEEGKALFNDPEVACASCHRPEQDFVDGFRHNVGTLDPFAEMRWEMDRSMGLATDDPGRLNTPSLKGLFYTAPYLHDGSAPDLHSVLERTGDTMGKTSHLTPAQRDALVAYLLTL